MGYEGGRPTDFITPRTHVAHRRAAHDMADRGGKFMTKRTVRRTPRDTGLSAGSIQQTDVRTVKTPEGTVYESGPRSAYENVRRLEYGTRPHIIEAKTAKALAFPARTGSGAVRQGRAARTIFAARVHHPGTKGVHMFTIAAAETEAAIPAIVEIPMREWALATERAIKGKRS